MGAPDEFHPDAHEDAREITGDRQYGEWGQCISQASTTGERCRGYAKGPHGKCYNHGGSSTGPKTEEGKEKSSQNAADHNAYRESFLEDYLTEEEADRVTNLEKILSTPEGSQQHARMMAGVALEQFKRSGDERFLREYRQICDKAGIYPNDKIEHTGDGGGPVQINFSEQVVETPWSEENEDE